MVRGDAHWSGLVGAGPVLGATIDLGPRFGIAAEGELFAAAYRRDGETALSFLPSAWMGIFVGL